MNTATISVPIDPTPDPPAEWNRLWGRRQTKLRVSVLALLKRANRPMSAPEIKNHISAYSGFEVTAVLDSLLARNQVSMAHRNEPYRRNYQTDPRVERDYYELRQ